jgi:hypothetical protein
VNLKEYISSGIVEACVLGLATPGERAEFEAMCLQYPEVLQARTDFERALERQAMENAITPDRGLRAAIFEQVSEPGKVILMQESLPRKLNWLKFAVAASLILLAGSIYWNFSLQKEKSRLRSQLDSSRNELALVKQDIHSIIKPGVKMASMKGLDVSPQSYATVYWDTVSHDVYLMVNNLPKPASDQQYQVWALLDGKPIDLGLIENEYFVKQSTLLVKAKNVQNAQAFAISLEKKGGSSKETPQGSIYVLGTL